MPVTYTARNRVLTVSLSGDIDHHRVRGLVRALEQEIDEVLPKEVVVDGSGVSFMDSSGIAVLLRLWRRMEELDGRVTVTGFPEQPSRVLRAAGLERLISIRDTACDAP